MRPAKSFHKNCQRIIINASWVCHQCQQSSPVGMTPPRCGLVRDRTSWAIEIYIATAAVVMIGFALIWFFGG